VAEDGTKWPKAVAKITDDLDVLLEFDNDPAEHRVHLRTMNPLESTLATVRLRQRVTRGPDRGRPAWRWRSSSSSPPSNGGVPSTHPTSSLSSGGGARFEKGLLVERPDESGGDQQVA
jgi:hypothetical protein